MNLNTYLQAKSQSIDASFNNLFQENNKRIIEKVII